MASPDSALPDLMDPGLYRSWAVDHVRFSDQDSLGHVNNGAIAVYFEAGRIALNHAVALRQKMPTATPVLARVEIDYRAELHFPNTLRIGCGVLALGRTSLTYGCGLFVDDRCFATSRAVLVIIDRQSRRPVALSDALRQDLAAYSLVPLPKSADSSLELESPS